MNSKGVIAILFLIGALCSIGWAAPTANEEPEEESSLMAPENSKDAETSEACDTHHAKLEKMAENSKSEIK
jgi:hypothetical protein